MGLRIILLGVAEPLNLDLWKRSYVVRVIPLNSVLDSCFQPSFSFQLSWCRQVCSSVPLILMFCFTKGPKAAKPCQNGLKTLILWVKITISFFHIVHLRYFIRTIVRWLTPETDCRVDLLPWLYKAVQFKRLWGGLGEDFWKIYKSRL